MGDIHGVGPSLLPMTPCSSPRCSCSSSCLRTWKGTLLRGCATGETLNNKQFCLVILYLFRAHETDLRIHGLVQLAPWISLGLVTSYPAVLFGRG